MKSLDKLRNGVFVPDDGTGIFDGDRAFENAQKLADEIEAEINRYYLLRPLFEDGEPVQFGDLMQVDDHIEEVGTITIETDKYGPGAIYVNDRSFPNDKIKRPSKSDTQEEINADVLADPHAYCHKRGIPIRTNMDYTELNIMKTFHLLERQRKVDGADA